MIVWLNRCWLARASVLLLISMAASAVSAAEPIRLKTATRLIPERGLVAGAVIEAGKNKDSFILPVGWRVGLASQENKVLLQSDDYSATMEIRSNPRPEGELTVDGFRDQVLAQSERCQIKREYLWPGLQYQTFLFEATDANAEQLPLRKRVLFLVKDKQIIEIRLTAQADRFESCQKAFEVIIASLRDE